MQLSQDISAYAIGQGRNHIVFSHEPIGCLCYHDVGRELATALRQAQEPYDSYGMTMQLFGTPNKHADLGSYIALQNINILFEPELQLDLRMVLESLSHEHCLFICTEAIVEDGSLHFALQAEPCVGLQGLSFITA